MKYKVAPFFDKEYPITQYYGERKDYYAQFGLTLGHEGVDYGTPNGTPVLSPFDGVILRDTFADKSYGNFTVVWDPIQKCALWFCHLQDITTKTGDTVKKGQLIGHTNNTGNSSGPHCHVNFVETDASGNRLNKDNGNQGFLDLLAYADISNAPAPQPQPQPTNPNYEKGSGKFDQIVKYYFEVGALLHDGASDYYGNDDVLNVVKRYYDETSRLTKQDEDLSAQVEDLKKQLTNQPTITTTTTPTTTVTVPLQDTTKALAEIINSKWTWVGTTGWKNRLAQLKKLV